MLKIKIDNLILSGDSSGGNICNALTNWCIVNGVRKPDLVFAQVPIYNYFDTNFTPSNFSSWNDTIVPLLTMRFYSTYYITEDVDAFNDSYVSPICTPDWILKEYPEFVCLIAEYDILRDDALRLLLRMLKLEKNVKILYAKEMKHDPLAMSLRSAGITCIDNTMKESLNVFKNWIKRRNENIGSNKDINRKVTAEKLAVDKITGWINL